MLICDEEMEGHRGDVPGARPHSGQLAWERTLPAASFVVITVTGCLQGASLQRGLSWDRGGGSWGQALLGIGCNYLYTLE